MQPPAACYDSLFLPSIDPSKVARQSEEGGADTALPAACGGGGARAVASALRAADSAAEAAEAATRSSLEAQRGVEAQRSQLLGHLQQMQREMAENAARRPVLRPHHHQQLRRAAAGPDRAAPKYAPIATVAAGSGAGGSASLPAMRRAAPLPPLSRVASHSHAEGVPRADDEVVRGESVTERMARQRLEKLIAILPPSGPPGTGQFAATRRNDRLILQGLILQHGPLLM